ncbi:hypothetical protein CPB84DRAFT_1759211, partial [Gymnopilus junonius]
MNDLWPHYILECGNGAPLDIDPFNCVLRMAFRVETTPNAPHNVISTLKAKLGRNLHEETSLCQYQWQSMDLLFTLHLDTSIAPNHRLLVDIHYWASCETFHDPSIRTLLRRVSCFVHAGLVDTPCTLMGLGSQILAGLILCEQLTQMWGRPLASMKVLM